MGTLLHNTFLISRLPGVNKFVEPIHLYFKTVLISIPSIHIDQMITLSWPAIRACLHNIIIYNLILIFQGGTASSLKWIIHFQFALLLCQLFLGVWKHIYFSQTPLIHASTFCVLLWMLCSLHYWGWFFLLTCLCYMHKC